jgi:thioredoxin-dependent peroxiredoxin
MAQTSFAGTPVQTLGDVPTVGAAAPGFTLTSAALGDVSLDSFAGKNVVLNIFPSVDTPVCATSVRKFNEKVTEVENTVVLCVSADLPFAQGRFCGAEGLTNVQTASSFRSPEFGSSYGVSLAEGAFRGLLARAVVVVGPDGNVRHSELVADIATEPNYDAAMASLG